MTLQDGPQKPVINWGKLPQSNEDRVIILCIGIGVITVIIPCITFSGPTHLVVILRDFFEITTVHCFGLACAHFLTQKISTIMVFVGGVQYHGM